MRKKTSVAFLAVLGLLLFGCGKKTTKDTPTTTKTPTPVTTAKPVTTEKQVKKYTVSVTNSIQNAGTISGTGDIEEGKSTTIKATANTGYLFLGFYDGETLLTDQSEYTISNITKNITITAKWTALQSKLEIKTFSNVDPTAPVEFYDDSLGTVAFVSEEKEKYATGEEITLKATPVEGYQFNGWYLVTSEGDHPISETDYLNEEITFKMYGADSIIKAVFGTKKCTYEIVSNIEGAMPITETGFYDGTEYWYLDEVDSITVDYGTTVTIFSENYSGYNFQGFYVYREDGDYSTSTLLPTNFVFNAEDSCKYVAWFTANEYDVNINFNIAGGSVNATFADGTTDTYNSNETIAVVFNTTVALKAEAFDGYTFIGWYSDPEMETLIIDNAEYTYTQTATTESGIWAKFAPNKVKINFVVPESMTEMCKSITESGYFDFDSEVTFTAYPEKGYVFLGWYVTDVDEETGETEDIKVSAEGENTMTYGVYSEEEQTFIAKFELGSYTGCGHINIEGLDEQYYRDVYSYTDKTFEYGSSVTFVAPEISGYTFKGWYIGEYCGNEYEEIDSTKFLDSAATYTFNWYYAEEDFTDDGCICFTAVYDRNLYKVEYLYSDGVNIANDQTWVKFGLKTQLELPTYTGYAFQYWYYNSDVPGEGQVILTNANAMMLQPYSVTGNLTLRAKWLDGKVIATFDTDGGSGVPEEEVQYNHPITKPANPKKDGYTFAGWYNADGQEWVFNQPIVENTTLYAHWTINQYTIALDSQDDSIVTVNNGEIDGTYDFNTKLQLSANVPDGYTFAGWYDEDTLVLEDAEGEYTLESHDVVLVAKFTINEYNVTVRYLRAANREFIILNGINTKFSANGEYIDGTTATYDYKTSISVQSTLLSQYVQYVSYYSLNGTRITSYTWSSSTFTVTYNFELPAEDVIIEITVAHTGYQFGVNKNITEGDVPYYTWQYNSSHYTSAGSWSNNSIMYLYAPNVTGYQFEGWYNGTTLVTTQQNGYAYTHAAAHETLTAKYSPLYYNVFAETVVDSHTGSDDVDPLIDDEGQYTKSYTVTTSAITGYSFLGWYNVDSGEYESTDYEYTFTMPHEDIYLQAIYEINSYNIYIQHDIVNTKWNELMPGSSNHGDIHLVSESYDYMTEVEFTITSNPGWKFKGIYGTDGEYTFTEADKNDLTSFEALADADTTTYTFTIPAGEYSLFILWEAKTYNVAYITNGGTLDSSMQTGILFGVEAQLKVPVWEGGQKDFIGWLYQDVDEAIEYRFTEYDGLAACYNIPKNIQLQAIWGQHLQDITFEVGTNVAVFATDTKTFIQKVPNGGYVNRPEDPVKKGHTFLGWFTTADGDVQWDFANLPVTEDKTIYAHWSVNSYSVTLRNYFGTNRGYLTYYVNDDINGTITTYSTSGTTFTIPFGSTLQLHAHMYIGWKIYRWDYKVSSMSGWAVLSTSPDYNYTLVQDVTTNIDLNYSKISSMEAFEYASTDTTCVITGITSGYQTRTSFTVPDIVTAINPGAFKNCNAIQQIILPWTGLNKNGDSRTGNKLFGAIFGADTPVDIDNYIETTQLYYNGSTVASATTRYIPKSLKFVQIYDELTITPYAFNNISSITTFEADIATSVSTHAFENCTSLMDVSFIEEDDFRLIGTYSFAGCTSLEEIVIPSSCQDIEEGCFANCYSLRSITAPFIGVEYFGSDASDMDELRLIGIWFVDTATCTITNEQGEEEELTYEVTQYYADNDTSKLTINVPKSFTEFHYNKVEEDDWYYIPSYGFYGFESLEVVTLPVAEESMAIYERAFYGCSNLNTINNLDYVEYIDYQAFGYALCGEITFGVNSFLDEIHSEAFIYSGLTKLTIYAYNLDTIFDKAFAHTDKLTEVYFYEPDDWQYIELYNEAFADSGVSEITFGKRVDYINNNAFNGCTKLKEVEFTTVSYIGDNAFYGCKALKKVTINEFINSCKLGDGVFSMCTSLSEVTMDKSLESVGQYIFNHCAKLNTIKMPFVGKDRNCSLNTYDVNYTWPYWFGLATTAVDGGYNMAINGVRSFAPAGTINIYLDDIINIPAYMFYRNESGTQNKASYIYWHITGCQNGIYSVGDYAFAANNSSNNGIVYTTGEELNNENAQLVGIGKYAFRGNGITNISALISNAITIGEHAFDSSKQAGGTTELVITNATTSIGDCAFACNWLTSITLGKNAVLGKFVFENFKDSVIYITYTGTGIEYNAIKGSWARTADEEWYAGSNISSVVTSDGNTYAVTA